MKKLKNIIFSKIDDGYYCIIRIAGVKIVVKPRRLQISMLEKKIKDIEYELLSGNKVVKRLLYEIINNNINTLSNNLFSHIDIIKYDLDNKIDVIKYDLNNKMDTVRYAPIIHQYIEYQKYSYNINIEDILNTCDRVLYSHSISTNSDFYNIQFLFKGEFLWFDNFHSKLDAVIIHGLGIWYENARTIEIALEENIPLLIEEDGFIRSCSTWVNKSVPKIYRDSISFTFSNLPHFFADEITTLEYIINNQYLVIETEQIERSKYLIKKILDYKITKYNHQPIYIPNIGDKYRKKVLVVDQSYGDMSIKYGWASEKTFENMLKVAVKDNPNYDIIIKTHPDALSENTSRRQCYYSKQNIQENVYLMSEEINPISLLEIVDKVYVCSSQLGFEALMMGKEVHVFGMPFYAGWGLTIDYQKCERRTNKRSLEEIFYITYIMHSFYVNPDKEERCEIEDAIDYLIKLRKEYFLEFNIRCDDRNLIDLSKRDFSLDSGERQVALSLEGIRKDHILRYELAATFLENQFGQCRTCGADIFCGNGYGSYLVASKLKNTELLSIDASNEAIALAKSHYGFGDRIKYESKFFPFNLEKDKYDYLISFESIEHVQNDVQFIEVIVNSIKNNGYWFLSMPNEEIISLDKNKNKFHFKHYTNNEIKEIFSKYNLKIIEQYGEDTYSMNENGLITGVLNEKNMQLTKNHNGQFMIYILQAQLSSAQLSSAD